MSRRLTDEEYADAVTELQESLPYMLQRREEGGVWKSVGKSIRGRTAAFDLLNRSKAINKQRGRTGVQYRVLPKNEADKYSEGVAAGRGDNEQPRRSRRPLLVLPDHL